jgi:DNA-directed RNA polymerase specialized sigma24 family protein
MEGSELEALYDPHAPLVFNFCLRTMGSRNQAATVTKAAFLAVCRDPQPAARGGTEGLVRLLAAARREGRKRIEAPGDDDAGVSSSQPVREANGRLDARYREALALRDLLGCSYVEIGRVFGADRATVADVLWHARLALRDELEGSTLLSIAPLGSSCRRALPLIVMHWDGELRDGAERGWLQRHLRTCGKCRLSQEAARQASAAYRDWPPAAAPLGMRESVLEAAESCFASDSPERPGAGSERSSPSPPGSRSPDAPRGARRSPR